MHGLVRGVFVAHLPVAWGARWRGDEKQLVALGRLQVLVLLCIGQLVVLSEIHPHAVVEQRLAVQQLAELRRVGDCVEDCDYAAEGFQWAEGVDAEALRFDRGADLGYVVGREDGGVVEVCDQKCV